ncbi:MAG: GNAT family N-acetyltransferase [Parasphingorhabdus sp.]|uniref:GNAT family N-acetyltransferase n=1 Tax=Parasphingorhabdus sp. TaxID=2709688 RepID=UPI0032657402
MPDISIRLATSQDAALLPDIERSAGKAFLSVPGLEWIASDAVMSARAHQIFIDEDTVWVATLDGGCIGFVTTAIYDDALHILELAVADGYQGQGIGRRLMDRAHQHAAEFGFQAVTLTTFRDLAFNEGFYLKLGYQTLEETEIPERLAMILQSEIEKGLPGDRRCAMLLTV